MREHDIPKALDKSFITDYDNTMQHKQKKRDIYIMSTK